MLTTTREQIMHCTQTYFLTPVTKGLTSKVVFGTEEVDKEELRKMGWMVAKPIDILP